MPYRHVLANKTSHTDLPSMMVITSFIVIWSLSSSSKSCRALISVGMVCRAHTVSSVSPAESKTAFRHGIHTCSQQRMVLLKLLCYLEQEVSEGNESWSVFRFGAPALQHDIVDILRTIVWFTQPLSLHVHLVKDLQTDT